MRKRLLLGAFTVLGLTVSSQAIAQEGYFKCGTAERLRKLYAENPQMEADYQNLVEQNREMTYENGVQREVITIPIVFHIIHENGAENLDDSQIYDAMEILNEDYSKTNPDANDVIPQFLPIVANAKIRFRLATIDPQGNCTNGIEHIYNNNTNQADDFSKLNQWHRSRYLNVWVVKTIGSEGTAGYAYYPTATVGNSFWIDGIIILNDYVGSIGTGNAFRSRALTHEIGHFLGLAHTWGSTNEPEVACGGDDNISDTPETAGHESCDLFDDNCNPGVVENVENFMEYSYCSKMFTQEQDTFMHNVLAQTSGGRNNLYTEDNLALTGANYDNVADMTLCAPQADFSAPLMACVGDAVAFKNRSWRAGATSFEWTFQGGTPATSTATNPNVTFDTPGYHTVTLKATNSAGATTVVRENVVYISATWADITGPYAQNFNENDGFFISQDIGNAHSKWTRISTNGKDNSPCFKLNNYKNTAGAEIYSDDYFYYNRLGNSKDNLITCAYDLRNSSNVTISFDYAYGSKTASLSEMTDKIVLYVSRDCGKTWSLRSTISAEDLLTAGYVGATDFAPTSNTQWRTFTTNYTVVSSDSRTRFKLEFVASDNAGNLYIDNFNIGGVLGISDNEELTNISVAPNPVAAGSDIAVEIGSATENMVLTLVNMEGKVISTTNVKPSNGTQTVHVPMNVAKGMYMLHASEGNSRSMHRVVVF